MMSDPMDGVVADGPSSSLADDLGNAKEVLDPMILTYNLARIERIQSVMGIASGCVAGIAGLTGLGGFGECVLFLFVYLLGVSIIYETVYYSLFWLTKNSR
jgi:EMC6